MPMRRATTGLANLGIGAVAGCAGTKAMEPVSTWLYQRESAADRAREDTARPGPPYRIAAQKTAALLGLHMSEAALDKAALVFHYGLGASWAPTVRALRRTTRLGLLGAGLASGAAMSAIVASWPRRPPVRGGQPHHLAPPEALSPRH
jgi:hypothetical protein